MKICTVRNTEFSFDNSDLRVGGNISAVLKGLQFVARLIVLSATAEIVNANDNSCKHVIALVSALHADSPQLICRQGYEGVSSIAVVINTA